METPVGRLVETIDRELREYADCGFSLPGDIAEWLAGAEQALWRLFASRANVVLTDQIISGTLDVYKDRARRIRKSIVKAYTADGETTVGGRGYTVELKTNRRRSVG